MKEFCIPSCRFSTSIKTVPISEKLFFCFLQSLLAPQVIPRVDEELEIGTGAIRQHGLREKADLEFWA